MEVRALAVEEERVWNPNFVQHLDARPQLRDVVDGLELESRITPKLTEVTVHREHLTTTKQQCFTANRILF